MATEDEIEAKKRELFSTNTENNNALETVEKTETTTETETQTETEVKPETETETKPETETQTETETKPETVTEEKTETRGRHKKDCNCEKCVVKRGGKVEEKTEEKPKQDGKKDLDSFLNQYGTEKPDGNTLQSPAPDAPKPKQQIDASKFINGAVFLMVMDAIFPFIIVELMAMVNPKYDRLKPSAKKKLKLDKDEKELLREGADEIVKFMFADTDPRLLFIISIGFIYFTKIDSFDEDDFYTKKPTENNSNNQRKKPVKK